MNFTLLLSLSFHKASNNPLSLKTYTSHVFPEHYPPQVPLKDIILYDCVSSCWGKSPEKCLLCQLDQWGVKVRWGEKKESIAWLVTEVFHPGASCPLANPQSPSSLFQHGKIQKRKGQNCVRTFPPDGKETEAEQYAIEVSTMHDNIPSPLLFLCVSVCASPSPLALTASPRLPPVLSLPLHSLTGSPSSSQAALVLLLMPALFSLSERERACFNSKHREGGGSRVWVMSSKCCECSLAVVQQCIRMSELLLCCLSSGLSKRHFL